jgi:uncharacterized protein
LRIALHPDQLIGVIERVDGGSIEFNALRAADHSVSVFGERLGRGEVGEFVIVDSEGICLLARIDELRLARDRLSEPVRPSAPVIARAALLASLDGSTERRGIARHPRIGDHVYAATAAVLSRIVATGAHDALGISLGTLSRHPDAEAIVDVSALLGRHLAILGTTGSGKSWTTAAVTERLAACGVRTIVIDATGEFSTLGSLAEHVIVGEASSGEPSDASRSYARLDHVRLEEPDLFRLLQPSPGAQVPKLRSAIASLQLAYDAAGGARHNHLQRYGRTTQEVNSEMAAFRAKGTLRGRPWSMKLLPDQLREECFREVPNGSRLVPDNFVMGHVGTLIARVQDLLHHESRHDVFAPLGANEDTLLDSVDQWLGSDPHQVLRICLERIPFALELRELIVNVLGRHLLAKARSGDFASRALVVVLDEAHQFLKIVKSDDGARYAFDSFGSIAKEGRKYGLHLVAATQRPGDLPPDVMSQMGSLLVHRLADRYDRDYVEHAASDLDRSALSLLPALVPGEALLVGVDFPVPVTIRVHRPTHRPHHVPPPFAGARTATEDSGAARDPNRTDEPK